MIEVFAKLDRGTVYLAGESIEGQVTFTNKGLFILMLIVMVSQNWFYKVYIYFMYYFLHWVRVSGLIMAVYFYSGHQTIE